MSWKSLAVLAVICFAPASVSGQPGARGTQAAGALSPAAVLALVEQAEAKSASRDWAAAIPLWERITTINPAEGRFWSRLAVARFNNDDFRGAIAAFERAIGLGSGAVENHAVNIAVAYTRLGDKDQAFHWLERALAMGFADIEILFTSDGIAPLRADPRFRRLIPVSGDTGRMSRAEGWRNDLGFLLWQMDRVAVAPYRLRPRSWFAQEFDRIAAAAESRTNLQSTIDLMRVLREVGDGHSGVLPGGSEDWALTLPIQVQAFDDGVYVVAADPGHRDLLGAQVLDFGGRPIETVMAATAETVSRDNEGNWVRLQAASRLRYTALLNAAAIIDERDGAVLHLRGVDGTERTVRIAADTSQPDIWNQLPNPPGWANLAQGLPGPDPLYMRNPGKAYWYEYLPAQRTVYFGFNAVRNESDETLAAFCERLRLFIAAHPVDKLVIDLRWNNGGNGLLLTPWLASIVASERINRRGRLFVLIGPRTFSAGQTAATLLERFTNAIFVGEPTGSSPNSIGEDHPFTLPYSHVNVNLSSLRWQNGWPHDRRTWIAPLIPAPVTFADYRTKRDPAMDAVLGLPVPN